MAEFIRIPFALEGDTEAIPPNIQSDGNVSMQTGYTYDYERDPETDASAKGIERGKMNWLFNVLSDGLRQFQTEGVYPYITAEQNGGSAFPYKKFARCFYSADAVSGVFESLEDNNTSLPTDASRWRNVSEAVALMKDAIPNSKKSDSTTSSSSDTVATSKAVKDVNDKIKFASTAETATKATATTIADKSVTPSGLWGLLESIRPALQFVTGNAGMSIGCLQGGGGQPYIAFHMHPSGSNDNNFYARLVGVRPMMLMATGSPLNVYVYIANSAATVAGQVYAYPADFTLVSQPMIPATLAEARAGNAVRSLVPSIANQIFPLVPTTDASAGKGRLFAASPSTAGTSVTLPSGGTWLIFCTYWTGTAASGQLVTGGGQFCSLAPGGTVLGSGGGSTFIRVSAWRVI